MSVVSIVSQLHRDGFYVVDGVIPEADVGHVREEVVAAQVRCNDYRVCTVVA